MKVKDICIKCKKDVTDFNWSEMNRNYCPHCHNTLYIEHVIEEDE